MSRKRLAFFFAALLSVSAAPLWAQDKSVSSIPGAPIGPGEDVEPGRSKLIFTYPCIFSYDPGGKLYEERVMDWQCDYMHASVKNADKTFNGLPSLAAQKAFLGELSTTADAAHNKYMEKIAEAIKKTDPSKLSKALTQTERLKRMAAMNVELSTTVFEAASPFLWPRREGESYVEKTAGDWPKSWTPYIQPIYERAGQLQGMVRASEMSLIDKAAADLDKTLHAKGLAKAAKLARAPGGIPELAAVFDGGAGKGDVAVPNSKLAPKIKSHAGEYVFDPLPAHVSDLNAAPPPIPETEAARTQRNYFARGVSAGLERLKDDGAVAMWHAMGVTATIGDPYTKAALIFHQKGPSCAVASQAEALHARGKNVPADQLAREGYDKGYFVDYEAVSGTREGGTPWQSLNALLKDHGVNSTSVESATPRDLDRALRDSPAHDAIVYVKVKMFWNDPAVPDSATHAVYITGEEVEPGGKVRGYYVNDTGQGEAARFVSAADFEKVWLKRMVSFKP